MISILIPVYNFEVVNLVTQLYQQGTALGFPFEIRCYDDGSLDSYKQLNRKLTGRKNIFYKELPSNLGRSKIRNLLADDATHPYLLFMDCDSGVVRQNYLDTYKVHLSPDRILYGGRIYSSFPPKDPGFRLHWTFGKQREESPAAKRRRRPYHAFMTNNFLIPKKVMYGIRFDERLVKYGHEDTLFGLELQRAGIPIKHIDNPLEHLGLETAEQFLTKTKKAIENLVFLHRNGTMIETKLLRTFLYLKKFHLSPPAKMLLQSLENNLERNLLSDRPTLFFLDLYKLSYFLQCYHYK